MIWSSRSACSAIAATMRGWPWPCVVTHQDEIASTIRRPSCGVQRRPLAVRDERDRLVQPVLGEGVPDRGRGHRKSLQVEGVRERLRAGSPRRAGASVRQPSRAGARRRSPRSWPRCPRRASPTKATPRIGTPRARSASIESRLWLIVPSRVRATSTTGAAQRANRSAKSSARVTGTSTPPAPSTTSAPSTAGRPAGLGRSSRRRSRRRGAASSGVRQPIGLGQHQCRHAERATVSASRAVVQPRLDRLPVGAPSAPASAAANTVLPMPVSVPVTTTTLNAAPPSRRWRGL